MQVGALQVKMNQVWIVLDKVHEAVHSLYILSSQGDFCNACSYLLRRKLSVVLDGEKLVES